MITVDKKKKRILTQFTFDHLRQKISTLTEFKFNVLYY